LATVADEHRSHVGGNPLIDAEEVRQIESAEAIGVPSCQDKRCHAPGLPGVASRDLQQALEGWAFMVGHCHVISLPVGSRP
jgi:hypothetical protein